MDQPDINRRIQVAAGLAPADCVIKNGKIIDVFTGEIVEADIAVADGYFAGIGNFEGASVIDAGGCYISPGFIDGHVHIESSMVTPEEFSNIELLNGVTAVVADPHEIANVSGADGIQYMIDATEEIHLDVYFMLPSCVPAAPFEFSGASLHAADLLPFYQHPRVLGLAEVMNFPAVKQGDTDMMAKILDAYKAGGKIDGHAAGLSSQDLNIYMAAGIRTDHEGTTPEQALNRLQKGMYLMIREGTAAKDTVNLLSAVTEKNSRRCLFVTDDRHLDDILLEGSINYNIRLALSCGIPPVTAIQMATLNTAECFSLNEHGAIAPGYKADFLFIQDLSSLKINAVFKNGIKLAENGRLIHTSGPASVEPAKHLTDSVHFSELTKEKLQIPLSEEEADIIGIIPNSIVTHHLKEKATRDENGCFIPSAANDQLKLAVIERHHNTGLIGMGIVKGLNLQCGAIATTVSHDSHNLIIAGVSDDDMIIAAETVKRMKGGLAVIKNGDVLASLSLPIAGLISAKPYTEVFSSLEQIDEALEEIGAAKTFNPFLTLVFLALPVIPELKLTVQGPFKVSEFKHLNP